MKNPLKLTLSVAAAALALAFTTVPTQTFAQRALGVDVSSYQGSGINWGSVRGAGVVFAWSKATEGTTITDSTYVGNQNNGKGAGMFMGSYHFARPNQHSPGSEAGYFWGVINPYTKGDGKTLEPMLDLEVFSGVVGATSYTDWANQFNNAIVADGNGAGINIKPFLYSSACNFCNFNSGVSGWFSDVANYSGDPNSGTPWSACGNCDPWGGGAWNMWQYSQSGSVPGIAGAVDRDVCNGTSSTITSSMLVTRRGLLNRVGLCATSSGAGYWIVASDGGIFSFGNAGFYGSLGGQTLNAPVVSMDRTANSGGYRLTASDGGVFCFGNAGFYGSMGGQHLNGAIVAINSSASGNGYWLVGTDGGIYSFGDAPFNGSMGGQHLNAPIVGMAHTPSNGYWLVGSDGGIYSFGAPFYGSMGGQPLNKPMIGMAARPQGDGYWLVASDGGVFCFGNAGFHGSLGGVSISQPIVGVTSTPSGNGYWMTGKDGAIYSFGDATYQGGANF